jgi:YVTN family beta-propeller protein
MLIDTLHTARRLGCVLLLFLAAPTILPVAAAATTAPKAYIGLFKDNAVAVLDTATHRVLSTIPVPPGPHGLVITPDGRKVYVSSDGATTVSVIDTATDRVVRSIEVGPTPHGLAMSPQGQQVLVCGWGANQVLLIDTASDQIVGRVPVPQPHNSVISPDGQTAYVGSQQQGATAVVLVDLRRQTSNGTIPLDKAPRALALSPDQTQLYVTVAGADALQVLDLTSKRIVGQVPVGASPHQPLFPPSADSGLVVSQGPGTLEIFDPAQQAVNGTVAVGKAPHWLAASSDGRTAYVTNEGSDDLSIVDLVSRTVTATIPIGHAPRKIAVQPGPGATAELSQPTPMSPDSGTVKAAQAEKLLVTRGNHTFSDHGTRVAQGQEELELEADDYYFAPTFLQGEPGQKLQLEIENESGTLHNISIPALGLDRDIPPKGKVEIAVTFPPSGVIHFFCKFHAALGMNGALLAGDAKP